MESAEGRSVSSVRLQSYQSNQQHYSDLPDLDLSLLCIKKYFSIECFPGISTRPDANRLPLNSLQ